MTTSITPILLHVTSPAFRENNLIPEKYGCKQEKNINPPISIKNIPAAAKCLALIVDDPDAPNGTFVHWVMWNIDPVIMIDEDSAPGIQGKNGKGNNEYTGPCPPFGTHHYHFKIYALDTILDIDEHSGKQALEDAMKHHIIARGELIGLYKKQ
ncbi:MAG TPA: YbhB/YbcL family Raf kinase inhibitor-like protein [Ferruginibacter sp.]|jgi:Raf kinase inhibitor-like YbhB/YbcL family protein|nr:YbhB/YbcL family Raf kinase inhibitor-like protein [Ferruginibacter sp.]